MTSLFTRAGEHVAGLSWEDLSPAVQARAPLVLLDTFGCAVAGHRLGLWAGLQEKMLTIGGSPEATLWGRSGKLPAAHAALVNGTVAHHIEMDDGNPRASLHGGVTIVPAALACAEQAKASGKELLISVIGGYNAAVACGRGLLEGIVEHRLHPPAMVGCFGSAAAAARLLDLSAGGIANALAIAGTLLPMGPFEVFTQGASVKDLYGGWPAYTGILSALLVRDGLDGPLDGLESPTDGLCRFHLHGPIDTTWEPDPDELLHVQFKAYATCRSVQPSLDALAQTFPLEASQVDSVGVETYPFAAELSADSNSTTPIGAKTSIPYAIASYLLDGEVEPEAFEPEAVRDTARQRLAEKVQVRVAEDMVEPLVRGGRVVVRLKDRSERRGEVRVGRWTEEEPATERELRDKFRRLAGNQAESIESAVNHLLDSPNTRDLSSALQVDSRQ